jgi:hypothetical protein
MQEVDAHRLCGLSGFLSMFRWHTGSHVSSGAWDGQVTFDTYALSKRCEKRIAQLGQRGLLPSSLPQRKKSGRIPKHFLDELLVHVPIQEVIGRYIKLKRRGREWVGLSPFNKEKTPSFTVSPQKFFYHCFSSGRHGDVFDFIMEMEHLSFPEAVGFVAEMYGAKVPKNAA